MSELSDLTDRVADVLVNLETLRDTMAAVRDTDRVLLPPACADAVHRLCNALPTERLDDLIEDAEDAVALLERAERAEA